MKAYTFSFAALAVASAAITTACGTTDEKTQVTIALASEAEIPKELDTFELRVFSTRTGELKFQQSYSPSSGRDFPTTLAVIPAGEESLSSPLRVEIEGRKGGTIFLSRQAVVSYIEGRNMLLAMPLRMACFQFRGCGPTETCAGGQCVASEVKGTALVDYDSALVFAKDGASCFDEERCLGDSVQAKIEPDCTFEIPAGGDVQGNVSIQWAAAPERILALEAGDEIEGWTRVGPGRGKLSQGACDSHFQRRGPDGQLLVPDWAKTVLFSRTCAPKTRSVPYCFSSQTKHAGIGASFRAPPSP